ncbi:hypothetical protein OIO90_000539 [Microbotryomycetes sp. JL221]|nr:hypothetical protein OIO90_000539 [Microbotryomycetes sp. JL221]
MSTSSEKTSRSSTPVKDVEKATWTQPEHEQTVGVGGVGKTQRRLNSRHITWIGIGSGIGTGLFIGSGTALANAGPLGVLLAYIITGFILWCVMQCICELAALFPVAGTFSHYVTRTISPSVGMATGWNYWWCYSISVAAELSACAIIVSFWSESVSPAITISVAYVLYVALNFLPVTWYAESEFIFSTIKVLLFVGLIILGIIIDLGGGPSGQRLGFHWWKQDGAFQQFPGIENLALGRFLAFFSAFINAAFTYIGIECTAIAAGESKNPSRDIPRAARRVVFRILFFYITGILLVGMLVSANNEDLVSADSNGNGSPFVIAIRQAGIPVLPSIVNACILTSAWSAGNAYLYTASRTLMGLSIDGQAPKVFSRVNKQGVPVYAVLATSLVGAFAYLSLGSGGAQEAFTWMLNLSTIAGLIAWATLSWAFLRFRDACKVQRVDRNEFPFKSPLQPFIGWFAVISCWIIIIFSGWSVFLAGSWDTGSFVASYIGLPIFFVPMAVWRLVHGKSAGMVSLTQMDLFSGRINPEDEVVEPAPHTCSLSSSHLSDTLEHRWTLARNSTASAMMQGTGPTRRDDNKAHTPTKRNGRPVQDINHLLGFTLPPRAPPPPSAPRRSTRRHGGHGAFDRARFVHQYRFIVRPDKDYTAYFADPDIRLDWAADVLQVILPTSASALSSVALTTIDQPVDNDSNGIPTCPICLSEPTAPRMTKCGHVFCLPCMLHYLALADGTKWRKCPVCWDSVYAKDLKAVRWHNPVEAAAAVELSTHTDELNSSSTSPSVNQHAFPKTPRNETLKMRLIRRPQISTLALPRSPTWPSDAVPALRAPWQFTPDALTYAKFMLAPPDYLKSELETNLRDLRQEVTNLRRWGMKGATDEELGIVFVKAAIQKVQEQIEEIELLKTSHVMTARKKALRELQEVQERADQHARRVELPLVSETSSSEVEQDIGDVPTEFLGIARQKGGLSSSAPAFVPPEQQNPQTINGKGRPQRKNVNPRAPDPDSSYYFYQAASGQNIFLHPLDIKILKAHFGTYEGMPDVIEVIVEGADEGTVTEDLRKRCRWLSHLPTACDVVFVEADLSRVVPKSGLDAYAGPLKQRRNKRRDKARREDRAKVRAEQKEAESMPVFHRSAQYSPSSYSVPLPPSIAALSAGVPDALQSTTAFPPPASSGTSNLSVSPPSSSTLVDQGSTTVWGTRSFASTLNTSSRSHHDDDSYDDDFDERWHDFEERITGGGVGRGAGVAIGRGGGAAHRSGSASGSNAGGGRQQQQSTDGETASTTATNGTAGGGNRKKGKKLTLNLTGAAMRGTR